MNKTEVLIIGGGISGLSTAWWLARQGVSVEVWEADERPGGKIRSTREDGYLTERAAGLLVNYHSEVDQLITDAGLASHKTLRDDNLNRYVIHKGQLTSVPMKLPGMMSSPLWSRLTKLRLMTEILIPRGGKDNETVSEFITRRLGREMLETAIDPFVAGTLASDPDKAEACSVLPRLTTLERRYGSLTMGMLINRVLKRRRANIADTFSFQGGMSELVDTLSATPGVRLRCGMRVTDVSRENDGWLVSAGNRRLHVPQLIVSTPADCAATLLQGINDKLSGLLSEIEYSPVAVLHMGLAQNQIDHALDGTGFLVPRREKLNFNGNLWMSRLFPGRAPNNKTLLTTYLGGARHNHQIAWDDEQITSTTLADLTPLLGIRGEPDYIRIDRHPRGLPMYHGSYQERIAKIKTVLKNMPGLHLNANYIDGVSVRERIFQGLKCAQKVSLELKKGAVAGPERDQLVTITG